jgi:hypothetical protein
MINLLADITSGKSISEICKLCFPACRQASSFKIENPARSKICGVNELFIRKIVYPGIFY